MVRILLDMFSYKIMKIHHKRSEYGIFNALTIRVNKVNRRLLMHITQDYTLSFRKIRIETNRSGERCYKTD
jgi:hypothetical protein